MSLRQRPWPAGLVLVAACSGVEFGPPAPLGAAPTGSLLRPTAARLSQLDVTPGSIAPPREGTMRVGDWAWFALELRDAGVRTQ